MALHVCASCFGMCNPVIRITMVVPLSFGWKDMFMSHKWWRYWVQSNTFKTWGTPDFVLLSVTESVFTKSGQLSCCKSGTRYSSGSSSACSEGRWTTRGYDCQVLLELLCLEMQRDRMQECHCKNFKNILTKHWWSTSRCCRRGKSRAWNSILHIAAESPVSFRTSSLSGELWRVIISMTFQVQLWPSRPISAFP